MPPSFELELLEPPPESPPDSKEEPAVSGANLPPYLETLLPRLEDIQPQPPAAIPSAPPPHEGAMIDIPITLQPPDLIIVDVLESLPGRPITGERLIRPDGTITLGFYGDIHVRGLTLVQAKTKIILALRKFLGDEQLGIFGLDSNGNRIFIPPADSDRVFVDMAAYNSDYYYVQGDMVAPGKLPITGNDTVLDAWYYAGGSVPTANLKDVKLVRPARGGQALRVYPIDIKAILDRGDPTANLQLFPGDRLIVGRDPVVTATIQIDRIVAPMNQAAAMVVQLSRMAKDLNALFQEAEVPPERRREIVQETLDLLIDAAHREDGEALDEDAIRALFEKLLDPSPIEAPAIPTEAAPQS